jgi:hypothetical protein
LGGAFRAERAATPARGGLALLHLITPSRFAIPLHPASERIPGTPVYAATLPGFINPRDASFPRLAQTDVEESPIALISRLVLGEVPDPALMVPASARPPGGEGGAVIDACGRLLGISTNSAASGLPSAGVAEMLRAPNAQACLALPEFVTAQDRGS